MIKAKERSLLVMFNMAARDRILPSTRLPGRGEGSRGLATVEASPYRFRIIKDSWNTTDTRDSRNMAKALWVFMVTGEFGLPTVYKPSCAVRELRKLCTYYDLITRQHRMLKNGIQALLVENGVELKEGANNNLLSPLHGLELICNYELSSASMTIIAGEMDLLGTMTKKKDEAVVELLRTGECFRDQVELLITIRGISPLTALAFLSDVGDISRFKSARKMDAYLGLVQQCSDSGGKARHVHITRESRKLTRTILTQSLVKVIDA
jgi:transposase